MTLHVRGEVNLDLRLPSTVDGWSESDVREEIIAPLLRGLGYSTGGKHGIVREMTLRYPRVYLGRKKPDTDGIVRGRADYICDADGRVRWTIEAKAPCEDISTDDIEQAYTYANHPEVRGVYYVLCNGNRFIVAQTNSGPNYPPKLTCSLDQMRQSVAKIAELLAPERIAQDWPDVQQPTGEPLAVGLRSVMRVVSGEFHYDDSGLPGTAIMAELQFVVREGTVQRGEDGGIVAEVRIPSNLRSMASLVSRLGMEWQTYRTNSDALSTDKNLPTEFTTQMEFVLPGGTELPFGQGRAPMDIPMRSTTVAQGWLSTPSTFVGRFRQTVTAMGRTQSVNGSFCLCLG